MVKYIVLVLLLLFIYNNFVVYSEAPKCFSNPNSKVDDSWYIFDLSEEKGSIIWDSANPGHFETTDEPLRTNEKSPLIQTFDQIKRDEFNHVTYNDQPAGKNVNTKYFTKYNQVPSSPDGGHTKGFFIWNKYGGIHVMHSLPNFPQYITNDEEINKGRGITWNKGINSIRQTSENSNTIIKQKQQAQYVYCYPLSSDQIKDGFIYRHLVFTNSIIGVANNLEIRNSLSFFQLHENRILPPNEDKFPKINFEIPNEKVDDDNFIFYFRERTIDEISKHIMDGIDNSGPFPLYLLSNHAYHFIVRSQFRHISSFKVGEFTERIYFYQRDSEFPILRRIINGESTQIYQTNHQNNLNIWEYASNFPNENSQIIGPIYLQTQHYYDPKSKGEVPILKNSNIYEVNRMEFGDNKMILTRKMDHSKQAFSVPSSNDDIKKYWFCVGDNNFMDKQSYRGGSVYCFINHDLWSYFSSKVESFKYKDLKQNKIINFNLVGIIKNYIIKMFSQALGEEIIKESHYLNKIFPIQPETELWVSNGKTKSIFSENSVKIDNGQVSFANVNYFCLPSFYIKSDWTFKTIICLEDETNSGQCLPENSYFLCAEQYKISFKMIKTLESIESDTVIQTDQPWEDFGLSKFNLGITPEFFFKFAEVSYIINKINQNMKKKKNIPPLLFPGRPIMVSNKPVGEKPSSVKQDNFEKYCITRNNLRTLYGTCIDFYFFCFDTKNKNINLFHEMISEIVGIDYIYDPENPFTLPDNLKYIQCGFYFDESKPMQFGLDASRISRTPTTNKNTPK